MRESDRVAVDLNKTVVSKKTSVETHSRLYWKETKNFGDGVSYHIQDSVFINDPNDGVYGILHSFLPGKQCAFRPG